mmetsp:Transcript_13860/g.19452  ORF Transcript_13860/g.19452 Transcript_13860/m.19452 type:complete len:102 (-) Transcript_13860:13-318(-)
MRCDHPSTTWACDVPSRRSAACPMSGAVKCRRAVQHVDVAAVGGGADVWATRLATHCQPPQVADGLVKGIMRCSMLSAKSDCKQFGRFSSMRHVVSQLDTN